MQVNANIPLRTLKVIFYCCLIGLLICICIVLWQVFGYSEYVEVPATVWGVTRTPINGGYNQSSSALRYIYCSYEWMENSYTAEFRSGITWGKGIGDVLRLRISPEQPERFISPLELESAILVGAFLLLFVIAMGKMIHIRKRQTT